MGDFAGFSKAGLDFLTTLGTKDKAWFDDNRAVYNAEVVAPAKAYVVAVGELLAEHISPGIEAQPKTNGSIAPINNDLRFNPDASPYKDHLMFRFWEGPDKKTSSMLMVRVHPTAGIGFASGMNFANVDAWRAAVDADSTGPGVHEAIATVVAECGADVDGATVKRVPKPFDPDHPRGDLLRHKSLQVRFIEKNPKRAIMSSAEFADWTVERLVRLADIHNWLVANLV